MTTANATSTPFDHAVIKVWSGALTVPQTTCGLGDSFRVSKEMNDIRPPCNGILADEAVRFN